MNSRTVEKQLAKTGVGGLEVSKHSLPVARGLLHVSHTSLKIAKVL